MTAVRQSARGRLPPQHSPAEGARHRGRLIPPTCNALLVAVALSTSKQTVRCPARSRASTSEAKPAADWVVRCMSTMSGIYMKLGCG